MGFNEKCDVHILGDFLLYDFVAFVYILAWLCCSVMHIHSWDSCCLKPLLYMWTKNFYGVEDFHLWIGLLFGLFIMYEYFGWIWASFDTT